MAACDFLKFGAILFAVYTACEATDRIEMSVSNQLPYPGDNVTITYTAYGLTGSSFIRFEKVFDDKEPVLLSTNHILEAPFKTMDRYLMELDPSSDAAVNKFVFLFTLVGIQEEDSGVFKALAAENPDISAMVEVNVRRDPDVIQLFLGDSGAELELTDGQTLEFEEEKAQSVRCVVSGSNPAAAVTMLRGDEDITDQFESTISQERTPTDVTGLEKISNTVTRETGALLLDFSFVNKPLKCVAKLEGSDTEITRSVNIKFKGFKPMIHCRNFTSYVGESDVNITCHVMASPPVEPENAHIYWFSVKGENKPSDQIRKLTSQDSSWGHYTAKFTTQGDEGTFMVLQFDRMFPQMFRSYNFVAKNDIGTEEFTVYMERDTSRENLNKATNGQFAINVQLSKSVAVEGDDVNVTCEITNEEGIAFFIVWVRKIDGIEYEIATNDHLSEDLKPTGKYIASLVMPKQDLTQIQFTLQMIGVDSSDNGEIGCRLPIQSIEVYKPFTVTIPISDIRMTSRDVNGTHAEAYVDGQVVSFKEGEVRQWVCRVNGSYPEPVISVIGGGKDITDRFEKKSKLFKSGATPGLQNLWYNVELSNKNLAIEYEFNNSTLECQASVLGGEPLTTGVFVELTGYKPKFLCSNTRKTEVHTPDVNITCVVKADPALKDVKFAWTLFSNDNETLEAGQGKGHYKASIIPKNKFETIMVLEIDRVFLQHFRKYYFMAENDLGKVIHEIELLEEDFIWPDTTTVENVETVETVIMVESERVGARSGCSPGVLASLSGAFLTLLSATLLGL